MKQNQFDGMTLTTLLEYINNLSEDGLDEDVFVYHFNGAINDINNKLGTLFPTINESNLNNLYPNIEYNLPIESLSIPSMQGLNYRTELTNKINISYPRLIKILNISKNEINKIASTKGIIQIQGLDLIDSSFKNIYRFKIQLGLDESNVLIGDLEKLFNVLRINSSTSPIEFFYNSNSDGSFDFYLKTIQSVGDMLEPLLINTVEDFNNDNFTIDNSIKILTKAEADAIEVNLSPIEIERFFYILPKYWMTSLLVPMIQKSIKIQEDEPYDSIQLNASKIDNLLNNFATALLKEIPVELFPRKKSLIRKSNSTGRYFK